MKACIGETNTINTEVGLDMFMSEQGRQSQVTLVKEKHLLIPSGCAVASLEMRRISCLPNPTYITLAPMTFKIKLSYYCTDNNTTQTKS